MPPPLETNSGGLAKDMTLRDWFAGQALAGLCANSEFLVSAKATGIVTDLVAQSAYEFADALIERERGE